MILAAVIAAVLAAALLARRQEAARVRVPVRVRAPKSRSKN